MPNPIRSILVILLLLSACGAVEDGGDSPKLDQSTYMRLAKKAEDGQKHLLAAGMYQRAIAENPQSADAYAGLGNVQMALGDFDAAIASLEQALQLSPENEQAQRNLAEAYVASMQFERAEKFYLDALNVKPDARLFNGLGVVYDLMGRGGDARQSYHAGLVLMPKDARIMTNLALSLGLSGDTKPAIKMVQDLLNSREASAKLRQNLAFLYVLSNQKPLAEKILRLDMDDFEIARVVDFYKSVAAEPDAAKRIQKLMRGIPQG